jgi:hypothetical protein
LLLLLLFTTVFQINSRLRAGMFIWTVLLLLYLL